MIIVYFPHRSKNHITKLSNKMGSYAVKMSLYAEYVDRGFF